MIKWIKSLFKKEKTTSELLAEGFYEEQEDGEFTSGYLKGPATWGINPAWTGEGPDIREYPYAKGGLATLWRR